MPFYALEIMQDTPASVVVVGIGNDADTAKTDCVAYYNAIDCDVQGDWDEWQDMAGDSGCELYIVELAVLPPEWKVKPID